MFGITDFFKNIQNAFTKEILLRTKIKEIIEKQTGISIPIENIVYKNEVVSLKKTNSSILSVIYIKKAKILEELKSVGIVKDIR
jgi:hypothetical protein